MYASPTSQAGILEPVGVVEIKYRNPDLIQTMNRIDDQLISLLKSLGESQNQEQKISISEKISNRQKLLLPIYLQIAIKFAELHDTSGRMLSKNCISDIVDWENSRSYFYARLKRRISEQRIANLILHCLDNESSYSDALDLLHSWYFEETHQKIIQDSTFTEWLSKESTNTLIKKKLEQYKQKKFLSSLHQFSDSPSILLEPIANFISQLPKEQIENFIDKIRNQK